ncbi:MAG: hypothetical protein MAG795_00691 [Candidatus Woesearchaeota archaeon]|nr:hypothetical protein [Candidatus Woesearchaeota archaeon]
MRYHELLLSKVRNTLSYNPNQEDYGFPISFQSRLEKNYSRFDHDEKNKPKQSATITLGVSSSNRQEQKILIRKVLQYLNKVHKIPQENMSKPELYRIEPEITLTLYNTKDMALEERIAAFDEKIEFIKSCLDKGGQFCLTKYYGK